MGDDTLQNQRDISKNALCFLCNSNLEKYCGISNIVLHILDDTAVRRQGDVSNTVSLMLGNAALC